MRESRSGSPGTDTQSPHQLTCTLSRTAALSQPHPLAPAACTHLRRRSRRTMATSYPMPPGTPVWSTAHRSARSRAGRLAAGHSLKPARVAPAAASSEQPPGRALRQCARCGCRRGSAEMSWLPRQCRASGHRLLEPTRAPPLARPPAPQCPSRHSHRPSPRPLPAALPPQQGWSILLTAAPLGGTFRVVDPRQHPAAPSQPPPPSSRFCSRNPPLLS